MQVAGEAGGVCFFHVRPHNQAIVGPSELVITLAILLSKLNEPY